MREQHLTRAHENLIEQGNNINGYIDDEIKRAEKDLHWLRQFYFNF